MHGPFSESESQTPPNLQVTPSMHSVSSSTSISPEPDPEPEPKSGVPSVTLTVKVVDWFGLVISIKKQYLSRLLLAPNELKFYLS